MTLPLMPKATAVWLIEKTALTFTQIADFCGMHPLEVQAIADGEVAQGIVGYDPVANSQLTADDIRRCEANPEARLRLAQMVSAGPNMAEARPTQSDYASAASEAFAPRLVEDVFATPQIPPPEPKIHRGDCW